MNTTIATATTTAATTATTDPILAFDLGKYKSVACIYRAADDHCFTGHRGPINALSFAPDSKTLASGGAVSRSGTDGAPRPAIRREGGRAPLSKAASPNGRDRPQGRRAGFAASRRLSAGSGEDTGWPRRCSGLAGAGGLRGHISGAGRG